MSKACTIAIRKNHLNRITTLMHYCKRSFASHNPPLCCFAICLLLGAMMVGVSAQETNPGRAPTGVDVKPGSRPKEADGLELRFSYFPSLNRLRLLVLRPPTEYKTWSATIGTLGQVGIAAQSKGAFPMPAAGETLTLPPLPDGTYELVFTLVRGDGARRQITRTFERKRFPWENNSLGRDRVVIPPFLPLEVDESKSLVTCVLRKHEIDGTGLWRQVRSQDRPLLTGPMRLEIGLGGTLCVAKGKSIRFVEKSPDRVHGRASWTAGTLEGNTEFEFDYDGLTKLTISLPPTGQRVESMQLVIPMRTDEAWLMHPVTDLLRHHYAGRIPNGKGTLWDYGGKRYDVKYTDTGEPDASGKVWDSRQMSRWQLPGPFVPYIWIGGTERGVCWFAENDCDWSLDPKRPALEIQRQGETTSLVVRLVTRPVTWTRPHIIKFGLMATPAKPMPETPVSFRRWWPGAPDRKTANLVNWGFLGSCYYWGGASPCHTFWPAFQNFSIYDEFVRLRKGGAASPAFVDRWLSQFTTKVSRQDYPEPTKSEMTIYRDHINWSVRFFAGVNPRREIGQTFYVIPFTNGRSTSSGEETRTFMDEWSTYDIADPRWPGEERFLREKNGGYKLATFGNRLMKPCQSMGIAYATDPKPSWQDMVLFYHKRMLETFADGIYFDDYFLVPNYNPLGPGYVDDEGKLHAGVNIVAFHDLAKRTAIMQHKMGRRPLVFIHMTNANIVPMLSFGTMILDHEWRDGGEWVNKDSQERLGLDEDTSLLLAQSTGLQSGCLAVYHDLFSGDERLGRSALGVALTHEMKFADPGGRRNVCRLADERLWLRAARLPSVALLGRRATGHDNRSARENAVLARGGKAMVVVASYGPAGEVMFDLDRKALGLADNLTAKNVENNERFELLSSDQIKPELNRE